MILVIGPQSFEGRMDIVIGAGLTTGRGLLFSTFQDSFQQYCVIAFCLFIYLSLLFDEDEEKNKNGPVS